MAVGTGVFRYLSRDIWRVRRKDLPRSRFLLISFLRVPILAFRKLLELRGSPPSNPCKRSMEITGWLSARPSLVLPPNTGRRRG